MANDILGMEQLTIKLNLAAMALDSDAVNEALTAGGELLVRAVSGNIRGQGLVATGALEKSFRVTRVGPMSLAVGSPLSYRAKIHEFGGVISVRQARWLVFNAGSGVRKKKSVFIPARPFVRPALESTRPAIMDLIREKLLTQLKTAIGG